jgi:SSS family solute:Na+ symporter
MQNFGAIDTILVIFYLVVMVAIGLYSMKKRKDVDDYYVGGRRSGTFVIGCLWMSSWIGGASVIGSVDKSYSLGITGVWYCGAMAVGCFLFAGTSTGLIQTVGKKFGFLTYPELIEKRYGPATQVIAAITTFLAYIAYTAGQFLAMGRLLSAFLGWDLTKSIWISALSMVIYTALGGFIAVTITGTAQAVIIMLCLSLVMVPVIMFSLPAGGLAAASLPPDFFSIGAWGWGSIIGLSVTIVLTFFSSMDSYTRCFASKTPRVAKMGTILAGFMVLIVAASGTYLGMAGRVLIPEMAEGQTIMSALITQFLPQGFKGLILIGLLAAVMSTGSVCILVATANITQDLYKRYLKPSADQKSILVLSTIVTVFVGILASYMGIYQQDIVNVLYIAFTVNSASLFIPTIAAFTWRKGGAKTAAWSMAVSLAVVLFWYYGQSQWPENTLFKFDPVWPGLIVSAGIFLIGALAVPLSDKDQKKIEAFWASAPA